MNAKTRKIAFAAAAVLLLSALISALASCGKADEPEDETHYLFAKVIEVGSSPLVEPAEGSWERSSADRIYINTRNMTGEQSEYTLRALRVGDAVRIAYDGMIAETYPARIDNASEIRFTDSNNRDVLYTWQTAVVTDSEYCRPGRPSVRLETDASLGGGDIFLLQPDYSNDPEVEKTLKELEISERVVVCFCTVFDLSPQVIDVFRVLRLQQVFGGDA